jgi:hypothetical protein
LVWVLLGVRTAMAATLRVMTSRAAPLLLAALTGFLLALTFVGVAFGLGRRYESALANPNAFYRVHRDVLEQGVRLLRETEEATADLVALRKQACEPRVKLVEVPPYRGPGLPVADSGTP